jgi:hypothetical protein
MSLGQCPLSTVVLALTRGKGPLADSVDHCTPGETSRDAHRKFIIGKTIFIQNRIFGGPLININLRVFKYVEVFKTFV